MPHYAPPPWRLVSPEDLLGSLNEIERRNAPEVLYVAGDPAQISDRVRVAIVGSRSASNEGLRRAAKLARFLVSRGAVVVSGLAKGIDAAAHRTAMEASGFTLAVLGTSLDEVYPTEHADLQSQIAREHVLISQFPSGHPTRTSNFPRRNRTMALLCHASVIVEAGESSGTLSQGWEALRLNRPLFIMRSIFEKRDLKWPSEMLDYGAVPLGEPEELRDSLPLEGGGLLAAPAF
jgi:DNA processing protein